MEIDELRGGQTVVVLPNAQATTVALQLWSPRGSTDAPADVPAAPALCGHLICTKARSEAIEVSSWAGHDMTVCEVEAPRSHKDQALSHLSTMLNTDEAALAAKVSAARAEVMQTWASSRQNPHRIGTELLFAEAFRGHGYGRPVLRQPQKASDTRVGQLCARWFATERLTIAAAGATTASEVRDRLDVDSPGAAGQPASFPTPTQGSNIIVKTTTTDQARIWLAFRTPGIKSQQFPVLELASDILGHSLGSGTDPLAQRVGLSEVQSSVFGGRHGGALLLSAQLGSSDVVAGARLMTAATLAMAKLGVSDQQLWTMRHKGKQRRGLTRANPADAAREIGFYAAVGEDPHLATQWQAVQTKTNTEAFQVVAEKHLTAQALSLLALVPETTDTVLPSKVGELGQTRVDTPSLTKALESAVAEVFRASHLPDLPTKDSAHLELAGGARLVFGHEPQSPGVGVAIAAPLGSTLQAERYVGAAEILSQALRAHLGPGLSVSHDHDFFVVSGQFLPGDAPRGLARCLETMMRPSLDETAVRNLRAKLTAEAINRRDEAGWLALSALRKNLYGALPYRHTLQGTVRGLDGIEPPQLGAFHSLFAHPSKLAIAVVGPVEPAHMARVVQLTVAAAPPGEPPPPMPQAIESPPAASQTVRLVTNDDTTRIIFGYPVNRNLTGSQVETVVAWMNDEESLLASRLLASAACYRWSVESFVGLQAGHVAIHIETAPENESALIETVHQVIREMHSRRPDEDAAQRARDRVTLRSATEENTQEQRAVALARAALTDPASQLRDEMDADNIATAARAIFSEQREILVIVGPELDLP